MLNKVSGENTVNAYIYKDRKIKKMESSKSILPFWILKMFFYILKTLKST